MIIVDIPLCIFSFTLPESPKLLIEEGKYDLAREQLRKLAKYSNIACPDIKFKAEVSEIKAHTSHKDPTILDFLAIKSILLNFIIVIFLFSTASFNKYMMVFFMKYIGGNIFLNRTMTSIGTGFAIGFAALVERYFNV